MKITYHIPTEQYGFIEIEGEKEEMADSSYSDLKSLLCPPSAPGEGLEHKEWNASLDRYVTDGTGDSNVYLRMSREQQTIIQELKKCFKRLKAKE